MHQLGGNISKDLPVINGFAAQLPITVVHLLAAEPGVKIISLDVAIQSSSGGSNQLNNPGFEQDFSS